MNRVRICFLTQYFYPDIGAPQARLYELAVHLAQRGHEMTVLTAMPFYPEGWIKEGYRGRLRMTETVNSVRIIRTWLYATKSARMVRRMTNYLSFAATALLLGAWGLGRQDILLVESPPLFLGPTGWILARLCRAKFVFNVSDVWPETAVVLGALEAGHPFARMAYWLEKVLYRHSDLVTGTSAGILENINARYPEAPTAVIPNAVDTRLFRADARDPAIRREFGVEEGQVAFVYAGLHGLAQGLEQVVEAARTLKDRRDIRFVMVGDGPKREELVRMAKGLANIAFYGPRGKKEMPAILASMDAALVPLGVELPGAMPSKSYEAMACGLPLVVASKADIAAFVAKRGVGYAVDPGDVAGLTGIICRLADDGALRHQVGARAREVALEFDRDAVAERVAALFEKLLAGEAPAAAP
jgi:glycosyltransferase involved in cell wall biosynthesis